MAYFPLFMDLTGKRVLVVGAGTVASRRIRVLADFGANVTVTAPEVSDEIAHMAEEGKIRLFYSDYQSRRKELLSEEPFYLVFAASGNEEADRLAESDGRQMGALVNVAGDRHRSDFYFPGIAREGTLTAGITAEGNDHAMARRAAEGLREFLKEQSRNGQKGNIQQE